MIKLKDMQLFCCVVENGNFSAAAKRLELSPAMVGRRVASIEKELGFQLLQRTTRAMQLTPGGKTYYEGCLQILHHVEELESSVTSAHQTAPKGLVRLSAPDGFSRFFLLKVIKDFQGQYPEIRFEVQFTNTALDLLSEQIDLSLRLAFELQDSSLTAVKLGATQFQLYASREYLQNRGRPECLDDLREHSCLHMGNSRYGDFWTLIRQGQLVQFRQPWSLVVPNTESLLEAVSQGMGIALLPRIFVENRAALQLLPLTGLAEFPELSLYGLHPAHKHLPYRVRLFLAELQNKAQALL